MYCTIHASGVFRWVVGMDDPKFLLVGRTLGTWRCDSTVLVSLELGCEYVSPFFLFFYFRSRHQLLVLY